MQIKCNFCGQYLSDTEPVCPHCGAPNDGVKRTVDAQPKTIEELKAWYESKGLPPAEVTRFFIGVDYKKPRAFGIYKDEQTGNFVVYKNKDSGDRAVRYEGKDEAYAVNELYQRLKQEIIQQKANNVSKGQGINSNNSGIQKLFKNSSKPMQSILGLLIWVVGLPFVGFIAIMIFGAILVFFDPKEGYYNYYDELYYRSGVPYANDYWFWYDSEVGEWSYPLSDAYIPAEFEKKRTAKKFYIDDKWNSSIGGYDFSDSIYKADIDAGIHPNEGYFVCDDTYFYHLSFAYDNIWYVYENGDWNQISYYDMPYDMQHSSINKNLYITEEYNNSIAAADFSQTIWYNDYYASSVVSKGYFSDGNRVYYHLADDYYDGWYTYDDDDDWYSINSYDLPDALSHPSTIEDFYYTPTWDSSTQFTDFEDTELYEADKDNWNSDSSSDSDSSWDWDSSDSWSSDSTDWGSDW